MALFDQQLLPQAIHGFSVNGLTAEAAHHKIDEEIRVAEKRIRDLRTLRNSIAPISQLPNEMLSEVMMHAHEVDPNPPRIRLHLSWVSRHWRVVALANPRLWRFITNHSEGNTRAMGLQDINECLARSKQLPLHISLQYPYPPFLDACLSQMHRVQALTYEEVRANGPIQCTKAREGRPINLWTEPAPCLSSLELRSVSFVGPEDQFLGGKYPKLKHISLASCTFNWNSPLWSASTITKLTISMPRERTMAEELVGKLGSMPLLAHCSLKHCITPDMRPGTAPRSIYLPSLRRLYVEDDQIPLLQFLAMIDVPFETSIEVQVKGGPLQPITDNHVRDVFEAFEKLRPYLWGKPTDLEVNGSPFCVETTHPSTGLKDSILFQSCHSRLSTVPASSCRHIATTDLEKLTVRQVQHKLYEVFGGLKNLKSITLDAFSERSFISELLTNSLGKKKHELPLPALQELNFEGRVFEDQLYRLLAKRKNTLKTKLPRLCLLACSDKYFARFKRVAEELVVVEVDPPVPRTTGKKGE